MSVPLHFLSTPSTRPGTEASVADVIAQRLAGSGRVDTLLDCLCATPTPAIHSPDTSRPPLSHHDLHLFLSQFSLPCASHSRLGPNDRVMLVLETGPENAVALLAVASYHTCAPVNANCTASELREDALRLGAKAIMTTRAVEDRLQLSSLREESGCQIIYMEPRGSGPAGLFDMTLMGEQHTVVPPSKPHVLSDYSLVLHTSGTSGKKKVVRYSLRSLLIGTWSVVESWGLQPTDVNFNMMPLFHVGGIVRNLLAPVLSGGSAIMCSECDPIAFWDISTALRATWYYAAPTIHQAIISARPPTEDLPGDIQIRMVCNAAGALLPSLAVDLKKTFNGATVLPSYGMTECMPIASPPLGYKLDRPGCSGIACGPHLSIRNPSKLDQEMSQGAVGAICVRGPPTFEGYEVSPDLTVPLDRSAFTAEGWFDSGDMGFVDRDGYLFITGRSKEIINKGGEVISPFEIEEAVISAARDYVQSTLAFSVDHDVLQETIGLVIVPAPNRPRLGLSQLQKLLKNHLHPSKWPFAIVYMNRLPKNSAGKPLRIGLASRLGLHCLSDKVPSVDRHFEADIPHVLTSLAGSIPCRPVAIDKDEIEQVMGSTREIKEFCLRLNCSGFPEALIFLDEALGCDLVHVQDKLSERLPGYGIPELHCLSRPLPARGQRDFDLLKQEIAHQQSLALSKQGKLVAEIVANILDIDITTIGGDSDFFLLGGNSLLLGQLAYNIRKQIGINIGIPTLFRNSTIEGIASMVDEAMDSSELSDRSSSRASEATLQGIEESPCGASRSQKNPLCLIVQAIPFIFFYPMRAALGWALLVFVISRLAPFVDHSYWGRLATLSLGILAANIGTEVACPLIAIAFKWVVIGRYKVGTYPIWSTYHLRWWIVDKALRSTGRGVFDLNPTFRVIYYRLLGARIGKNVLISDRAELAEPDLLTIGDGCWIDFCTIRGFCLERESHCRLDKITLGRQAVINTNTVISPGAVIAANDVYGPHASSHDLPSPTTYSAYSQISLPAPHILLQTFVAWPIISLVYIASHIPWAVVIFLMFMDNFLQHPAMDPLESVIWWFSTPNRIAYHFLSKAVRATITPLLHLFFAILVKRALGLNKPGPTANASQLSLLRRYINSILLSQLAMKEAFLILGTHYEVVSMIFRALGAKVGKRVYWPGSSIYCLDHEMLDIGDDVVFGSRSDFFTTDHIGTDKIVIEDGAMVADRVVLLPGTRIGRRTVMGSGSLGKRNKAYGDGETWLGNEHGEAICLSKTSLEKTNTNTDDSTLSPFGKAFYLNQANYFVLPYPVILFIGIANSIFNAAFWSTRAVSAALILHQFQIHAPYLRIFEPRWYRFGILYGLVAGIFIVVFMIQAVTAFSWVIATKWAIIGQRQTGRFEWDESDYCQRWQLHLTLTQALTESRGGGGIIPPLTGSVYLVWYLRAMGAKIGKECSIFAGGRVGLMTEPDLVEIGDKSSVDDCSVVAHINSRGIFSLNRLKLGNGCVMRIGSRLLSGASMEDGSMLYEHTLLASGEVADSGTDYTGWPAKPVKLVRRRGQKSESNSRTTTPSG